MIPTVTRICAEAQPTRRPPPARQARPIGYIVLLTVVSLTT